MGYDPIDTDETDSNADTEITVDAINGADTSAAAAGEALLSDGSSNLTFGSGGGKILRNDVEIDYVTLDVSNLPTSTGSGDVALVTASGLYVQDNPDSGTPFDITSSDFSLDTDIPTQDSQPTGIAWNADGSRLYELGQDSLRIYQYTVSTPFDIDTASFSTDISTEGSNPEAIAWNDDGSRLYEVDSQSGLNSAIYQYTVSTPFDIDTASLDTDIPTQDANPQGIAWNDDGSRLYETGYNSDKIYQSTVSTPYDIDTASFDTDIPAQDSFPEGIAWNNDGSRLIEVGSGSNKFYQYTVSTPFDISSASFDTDIPTQDSGPSGIAWNDVGSRLYEVSYNSDRIYQYTVSSGGWEAF